jgi:hypothetical protein
MVRPGLHNIMDSYGMSGDKLSTPKPTRRAVFRLSAGTALVGASVACRELARSNVSEEKPDGGPVIDTHIHVVSPELPGIKSKPDDVLRLYQGPRADMVARLEEEMKQANLEYAFAMGCLGGPPADPLGIGGTLELAKSVPRLRAIGIADPRRTEPAHLKLSRNRSRRIAARSSPVIGSATFRMGHWNTSHRDSRSN